MNLRDLEAFMAVVDTGSIGAAARRLNLTQPAVTRRVQNLEQDLGAPLLRRESKPPRLTIDGEIVAVSGRQVLRAVDDLRAGVAAEGEPIGQLRLGVAQAVGDLALGKPIGALRAAYPQLAVQLVSGWTRTLLAAGRQRRPWTPRRSCCARACAPPAGRRRPSGVQRRDRALSRPSVWRCRRRPG